MNCQPEPQANVLIANTIAHVITRANQAVSGGARAGGVRVHYRVSLL